MRFISYAQNYEDVMLWRAFGSLKSGFYIDVGAHNPINDSVTYAFYKMGWHGINIEPMEQEYDLLTQQRPNDVNLKLGVGDTKSLMDFYEVLDTGLSTFDSHYGQKYIESGRLVNKIEIEVDTLESICGKYAEEIIHFMKIDVEGFELQVLNGANFKKFRPKIIVVESTEPNTQISTHMVWEQTLIKNGYSHCYSDGLNRYYLAAECEDLRHYFSFPPNVFDNFVTARESAIESKDINSRLVENVELENLHEIPLGNNVRFDEEIFDFSMFNKDEVRRIKMTVSCEDSEPIPKVGNAGGLGVDDFGQFQIMHNGLKITRDCYYGPWMTKIIQILRGHHEPQEELAFYKVMEILKRTTSRLQQPSILELGSFWAYYSMWFLKEFPQARAVCIEPDPAYLEIGKQNFVRNGMSGTFINAQIAIDNQPDASFICESDGRERTVESLNFTGVLERAELDVVDLVLVDIQGAEIDLLLDLSNVRKLHEIRFILVSTHDLAISGSPITHQSALKILQDNGAFIILEHSVSESYSGDGFILASFLEQDRDMEVNISYNRSKYSLFGEWETRLEKSLELTKAFNQSLSKPLNLENNNVEVLIKEELESTRIELHQMVNSKSWRLTSPLRKLRKML